jgi:predicted ribosomally synthesized peptide with SipW-like signal peptide
MKRILKSFAILVVVGAIAGGATYSFFSDKETSTGNTFTAGSIDLKVDHTKQIYNGVDCKTCSVMIKSDTTNLVTGTVNGDDPVVFPHSAVPVTATWITNAYWTHAIPDAAWVWATDPVTQHDSDNSVTYSFQKDFSWYGPVTGASMSLGVAADNNYTIYLNGHLVAADNSGGNSASVDNIPSADISPWILQGANILKIDVTNLGQPQLPIINNPAGLLYKLEINGNCGDDYFKTHCNLWGEKDLAEGDKFWKFDDVKPGDNGVNVISLHPYNNNAWACMSTANEQDLENTIIDPENEAGDTSDPHGELSPFLKVFTWWDTNGNGTYDVGEIAISTTDFGTLGTMTLADGGFGPALIGGQTKNMGLYWCAGTLASPVAGQPFACGIDGMDNTAQTDSYRTDIVFYAEQERNNSGFRCLSLHN